MDAVSIISSVSKIAILAFAVTLGVVIYEVVVLLKKQRAEKKPDEHVDIPDFDGTVAVDKHFTEIPALETDAPVEAASITPVNSKLPLILVGVLCFILIGGLGYFMFARSSTSKKADQVTSPLADTNSDSMKKPTQKPTRTPSPTAVPTSLPTLTPTLKLTPTIALTTSPVPSVALSPTSGVTSALTPTVISASPTTVALPTAGNFQTPLLISVVSVAVIYLALIL